MFTKKKKPKKKLITVYFKIKKDERNDFKYKKFKF